MTLQLRPELQRFVDDQVRQGRFTSPEQVVEAGLARLLLDQEPDTLDQADVTEISESLQQLRSGQTLDWKSHSAELRKKYLGQ